MTKRALCAASNYPGTTYQLAGCANDAKDWAEVLAGAGYAVDVLLDQGASRSAVLDGIRDLIEHAEYRDRVVITWSGHGTWVPDRDGDERDRRDEAICPNDLATAGVITDDDLYVVFNQIKRGVRVLFIADSCYSGTLQRFAPPLEQSMATFADDNEQVMGDRQVRFLAPSVFLTGDQLRLAEQVQHVQARSLSRRSALVMSSCADTEVCYDAWFGARPNGAFTYAALQALRGLQANDAHEAHTYRDWYRAIRTLLPSVDYAQTPQLDGLADQKRWQVLV